MSLPWWQRVGSLLNRATRGKKNARKEVPAGKFFSRLWVEPLEDRTLLSTYQWLGTGATTNWNDPTNWTGGPAGTFPSVAGDVAQFTGTFATNQTAVVNQAISVGEIDFGTAKNITVSASGGSVLTLDNSGTA